MSIYFLKEKEMEVLLKKKKQHNLLANRHKTQLKNQ